MSVRQDLRALPAPYRELHDRLADRLPRERLIVDPLRVLAYGTDASFYRLVPKLVVRVRTADEVQLVLREAGARGLPVTFRAAGTSLSGQAVSDSVLVVVAGGFRNLRVLDGGARLACEPGVIGACMIGGIAANNASGMCCGTSENTYRTVESMKVLLWDGTPLDTADPESRRALQERHPEIVAGLAAIRDELRADEPLRARIAE